MKNQQKSTRTMVLMALFIAMSVVGGYIKFPNPITSSVAFDSLPAFLSALILGGIPGAIIGFLGHMVSAAIGGFPLTLPIHLLIGLQMAIIMFLFNFIAKRVNLIAAVVIGIILNGIVSPACFILVPSMGIPVFTALLVPLVVASVLNVILAAFIYQSIKNTSVVKGFQENSNGIQR